jgi:hypothetical protein
LISFIYFNLFISLCFPSSFFNLFLFNRVFFLEFLCSLANLAAQTSLMHACREGQVAIALEILKALPPNQATSSQVIDTQDINGDTALHCMVA